MPEELRGIGVSPGLAAGPVARMSPPPSLPEARTVTDPDAEVAVAARALEAAESRLRERAAVATGAARDILDAQSMIAADPTLKDGVTARIKDGTDAPHALRDTFDEHRGILEGLGGYLAERAADLDDIAHRAIAAALGLPMPGVPQPGHPYVLVADDLAPADTATLDPESVLALVTERGGPTSHTAILARSLGMPAVVGCAGALGIADATAVTVDGTTGLVHVGVGEGRSPAYARGRPRNGPGSPVARVRGGPRTGTRST